jgi:thiol-disulfide isomerase/thioredoxin
MRSILGRLALVAAIALSGGPAVWAAQPRVGAPAPAVTVRTLGGQEIDLTHLEGKVAVVNLWATWCAPCRAEMPMLNAFYLQHRNSDLLVIGLSADRSRDKPEVGRAANSVAYPTALLSEARVDKLDEPRVLPMTYVIDKKGVVRATFGGTGKPLTAQALADAVGPLL